MALLGQAATAGSTTSSARLIHTEPSEYEPVVVFEQFGERCMNFIAIDGEGRQSCYKLNDPDKFVFEYTRMMATALFVVPAPDAILIVGLGGATLPNALHSLLPNTLIDTVEIDPAVIRVARRYFGYQPSDMQRVFAEDGRAFVERAHHEEQHYDIVMLDAFDSNYIPAHLQTVEFLQSVHDILTPGGVVVANSFTRSEGYNSEAATYATVFGDFFSLHASLEGNRVIIARHGHLPDPGELQKNARTLAPQLQPLGINATNALSRFKIQRAQDISAPPLRD